MTIRKRIEDFIYPFLEKYTDMLYIGGEDTVFHGVRLLDDEDRFAHGALVNAAATLYVYYERCGDKRADLALKRLHYFIKISAENDFKTWGKIAILRGFLTLHRAGLLDRVDKEYLELVKSKTEYDDFFDKETLTLRNMPTNYLQVAFTCAALRERLGFESDGYSAKIIEKLTEVLSADTENGWMDDEIPFGRFDRYAFVLSSEIADTARIAGLTLPDFFKNHIRLVSDAILFCANNDGNFFSYGRSLAGHGDGTAVEVLSTALAEGLINESDKNKAVKFCYAVINKIIEFWFDKEKYSINMWWGGRGHDSYRPVERLLETNLDAINHLFMYLENLTVAGAADVPLSLDINYTNSFELYPMSFMQKEGAVRKTLLIKKADMLIMLPFVGFGDKWGIHSAYFPYPAISGGIIEAAQSALYPYYVPEYTDKDGNKYLPVQHFTSISYAMSRGKITVHAEGILSQRVDEKRAIKSDYTFSIDYVFHKNSICVSFDTTLDYEYIEMYIARGAFGKRVKASALGFEDFNLLRDMENDGLCAPHGNLLCMLHYFGKGEGKPGYIINL